MKRKISLKIEEFSYKYAELFIGLALFLIYLGIRG